MADKALSEIINHIKESKNIVILPHIQADGDALGSGLALALALDLLCKNVTVYLEEDIPQIYDYLPGRNLVTILTEEREMTQIDMAIAVDTADFERLGERGALFREANFTVNIDHHQTNTNFADLNQVNPEASAAGEIVYNMIKEMKLDLNSDMRVCLFTAIITDTGGFRYSNTTSATHLIASDLIRNDIDVSSIFSKIYDYTTEEKTRLMGRAINSLEIMENGKIASITVTERMMKETEAAEEESEGIINLGRNIIGVEVAVLFKERQGEVKVSFRSNTYVDVSIIASIHSGGGHKRAAGCLIKGQLREIKQMVLEDIKKAL